MIYYSKFVIKLYKITIYFGLKDIHSIIQKQNGTDKLPVKQNKLLGVFF